MPVQPNGKGLLSGVRIVELGHVFAGPFATALCADFGAEVIKIEDPNSGDMMRGMGPAKDGKKLWWKVAGRNKKCVTLNLKDPRGLELCRKLITSADALVENYRPGALDRLGLSYDQMRQLNPKLVIVGISGYGRTGPQASMPGFGRIAEAMSGLTQLIGERDGQPLSPGLSAGDGISGLMAAFALMMALYHRDAGGGKPVTVDLALFETLARMLDWQIIMHDQLGIIPARNGTKYPIEGAFISNVCKCADGKWITVSGSAAIMRRSLATIGSPELAEDARFRTDEDIHRNTKAFDSILAGWLLQQPRAKALEMLGAAGVTCGPIFDVADIVADPQFLARGQVVSVPDRDFGSVRMPGIVPTIPEAPGEIKWTGPDLGQHNREVFGGLLGLSDQELETLKRDGVV